jgi:hypothetical protein
MGRGLSELQKTMLTMPHDEYGHIDLNDVIAKYYGWPQHNYKHFSKKEIGQQKYMSGYMAARKAFARLMTRELIYSGNRRYYTLTQAGREVSAKLSAEPPQSQDPRFADKVEMRYLKDVNLLLTGEYMHHKGKIIEVSRYEAERMLRSGVFEMV